MNCRFFNNLRMYYTTYLCNWTLHGVIEIEKYSVICVRIRHACDSYMLKLTLEITIFYAKIWRKKLICSLFSWDKSGIRGYFAAASMISVDTWPRLLWFLRLLCRGFYDFWTRSSPAINFMANFLHVCHGSFIRNRLSLIS